MATIRLESPRDPHHHIIIARMLAPQITLRIIARTVRADLHMLGLCQRVRCLSSHARAVTFVGGGNGSIVGAAVCALAENGFTARVMSRRPELWSTNLALTLPNGEVRHGAQLEAVSADPADVIPGSEIVVISSPVSAYAEIFAAIAPHLDAGAFVGTMFCQGHVDIIHLLKMRCVQQGVSSMTFRSLVCSTFHGRPRLLNLGPTGTWLVPKQK